MRIGLALLPGFVATFFIYVSSVFLRDAEFSPSHAITSVSGGSIMACAPVAELGGPLHKNTGSGGIDQRRRTLLDFVRPDRP